MLDKLIKEKADLISYSQDELRNIASTLNYLKQIVNNEPDFQEPFLGGSYKRATMVKGISDVDVYFRYIGTGTSQIALTKLKTQLVKSYPNTDIKRDKPSIVIDFQKIPMNITPYKEDAYGNISIPHADLFHWQIINFGQLEKAITLLRQKSTNYIDLIKILKLWNKNYYRGLKNFDIEQRVCNEYLNPMRIVNSLSDCLWAFFHNNSYMQDARLFQPLMHMKDEFSIKSAWLKFIENRA